MKVFGSILIAVGFMLLCTLAGAESHDFRANLLIAALDFALLISGNQLMGRRPRWGAIYVRRSPRPRFPRHFQMPPML